MEGSSSRVTEGNEKFAEVMKVDILVTEENRKFAEIMTAEIWMPSNAWRQSMSYGRKGHSRSRWF